MRNVCYILDDVPQEHHDMISTTEILKQKTSKLLHDDLVHVMDDLLDTYHCIEWYTKYPEILQQASRLGNLFNGRVIIADEKER